MHALGLDRVGYYKFLRRVYGMFAWEALTYINRMGVPPTIKEVRDAIQ